MERNKLTKKMIINATISFAIIIAITYFIIIPSRNDIKNTKNNIEQLRISLETKYIKGQSLRKISEGLKTIETEIPKLDKVFIKKSDAINFVTSLENIAIESNITQRISLTDEKGGNYQKNALHLFTDGNFFNQTKYLQKLETIDYYININSLEIQKGSGEGNINMQVSSNTYWLND